MTPGGAAAVAAAASPAPVPPGWLAPALAVVAAFVDTTGFIFFGGLFVAHVTGNFVVLGAELATGSEHAGSGGEGVWIKLSILPLFVVGVIIAWLTQRSVTRRGPLAIAIVEGGGLCAAGLLGHIAHGADTHRTLWTTLAIAAAAMAMGVHSVLSKALRLPMTHVMTGNVTQLTLDILDASRSPAKSRGGTLATVLLVIGFAVGAVAAGVVAPHAGLAALLIPGCLTPVLVFIASRVPNAS